jgi:uncharacterized SAM-binding protein YcdF (DUF218 family)
MQVGRASNPGPADAILVFGAAVQPDGPSPALQERLQHAVDLHRQGCAPLIVSLGGNREVQAMRSFALDAGLHPSAVAIEPRGVNTRASIAAVADQSPRRFERVIVVSSPYHMHRILVECRRQNLPALSSPAPGVARSLRQAPRIFLLQELQYLRETLAVWWYALTAQRVRVRAATHRAGTANRPSPATGAVGGA